MVNPMRAVELFQYQQIISQAATRDTTAAWLTYDESFRKATASGLTKPWNVVDGNLWSVTFFTNCALPACYHCHDTTHMELQCPNRRSFRAAAHNNKSTYVASTASKAASPSGESPKAGHTQVCRNFNKSDVISQDASMLTITPSAEDSTQRLHVAAPSCSRVAPNLPPTVSSKLNVELLSKELASHPDKAWVSHLVLSLSQGFRVHYKGPRLGQRADNLRSPSFHP